MLDKVRKTISDNNMISENDKVLVALSGGCDSVCLCLVLKELGITQKGNVSDDGCYVVDFNDYDDWVKAQSRLERSNLVDELTDTSKKELTKINFISCKIRINYV